MQPPFPSVSLTAPQGLGLTSSPRFRGSYLHLHYGYLPDALVDLTGGVVTSIDLHSSPSDLVTMVKTAANAGSLMTCATPAGVSRPGILCMGLGLSSPGVCSHWLIQLGREPSKPPTGAQQVTLCFTEVTSFNAQDSPPSEIGIEGFADRRGNGLREAKENAPHHTASRWLSRLLLSDLKAFAYYFPVTRGNGSRVSGWGGL